MRRLRGEYSFFCTDEERRMLEARAGEDGVSVSDFIVKAAMAIDPPRGEVDKALAMARERDLAEAVDRVIVNLPAAPPGKAAPLWETLHERISFLERMAKDAALDRGCWCCRNARRWRSAVARAIGSCRRWRPRALRRSPGG